MQVKQGFTEATSKSILSEHQLTCRGPAPTAGECYLHMGVSPSAVCECCLHAVYMGV